jgi:hypothetical protein
MPAKLLLGSAASGASLLEGVLQDKYEDVHGFSACAQNVTRIWYNADSGLAWDTMR